MLSLTTPAAMVPTMSDFDAALSRYATVGAARADDVDLMASFCKHDLQLIVGAVSPKLVWEGACKKGLTAKDLMQLAGNDTPAISDLQWL